MANGGNRHGDVYYFSRFKYLTSWNISNFTLTIDFGSHISTNHGIVRGENAAAAFYISSSTLTIGQSSYFEAAWNNFFSSEPQSSLVVFYQAVWLRDGGSMSIRNNSLNYGFPLLTFYNLSLDLNSNIGLIGNTVTARYPRQSYYYMILVTSTVFTADGVGSDAVWMCGNNIQWFPSGDRNPNVLVSLQLSGLASTCNPLPTTTTTTKPATTKRPTTTTTIQPTTIRPQTTATSELLAPSTSSNTVLYIGIFVSLGVVFMVAFVSYWVYVCHFKPDPPERSNNVDSALDTLDVGLDILEIFN